MMVIFIYRDSTILDKRAAEAFMHIGGFLSRRFMNGHVYYYVLSVLTFSMVIKPLDQADSKSS